MVYATVKKTGSLMKPSFGVFMHNPPIMIEDCDHRELADHPDFRIEATLGGHFVILQVFFLQLSEVIVFEKWFQGRWWREGGEGGQCEEGQLQHQHYGELPHGHWNRTKCEKIQNLLNRLWKRMFTTNLILRWTSSSSASWSGLFRRSTLNKAASQGREKLWRIPRFFYIGIEY